jgi:hypothetical protein
MGLIARYYCSIEAGAFNSHERHDEGEKGEKSGGLSWLRKKEISVEIDLFSFFPERCHRFLPPPPPRKSMTWLTDPLLNESLPDKYRCHVGLSHTNSKRTQQRYSIQPLFYFFFHVFLFLLNLEGSKFSCYWLNKSTAQERVAFLSQIKKTRNSN